MLATSDPFAEYHFTLCIEIEQLARQSHWLSIPLSDTWSVEQTGTISTAAHRRNGGQINKLYTNTLVT